jgi:hypothetical protein
MKLYSIRFHNANRRRPIAQFASVCLTWTSIFHSGSGIDSKRAPFDLASAVDSVPYTHKYVLDTICTYFIIELEHAHAVCISNEEELRALPAICCVFLAAEIRIPESEPSSVVRVRETRSKSTFSGLFWLKMCRSIRNDARQ